MTLAPTMEGILNFSEKLDVGLLDRVVQTLYFGHGAEVGPGCHASPRTHTQQQGAQRIITQFQEHPDAWQRVDYILEFSASNETRVGRSAFGVPA